jgi:hypothetical protein
VVSNDDGRLDSATIVTAVMMGGMFLGAFWAFIRRRHHDR